MLTLAVDRSCARGGFSFLAHRVISLPCVTCQFLGQSGPLYVVRPVRIYELTF
jgi:hypothetical protein